MKKILAFAAMSVFCLLGSFAGDSAVFVEGGFSKDGKYYVFGQYGRFDKDYRGWAEIYTVDILKNDYVDGKFWKKSVSSKEKSLSSKSVYESLYAQKFNELKKYECEISKPNQVLYIREDDKKDSESEIVFKDFISSLSNDQGTYHVQLVPEYKGKDAELRSSFFIMLEKRDYKGNVLARQKIGTPSIKRKGVKNYRIERIVCDSSGKNLVIIIEKTVVDKTGVNIRYMIEACRLNQQFWTNLAPKDENDISAEKVIFDENEVLEENAPIVLESTSVSDAK